MKKILLLPLLLINILRIYSSEDPRDLFFPNTQNLALPSLTQDTRINAVAHILERHFPNARSLAANLLTLPLDQQNDILGRLTFNNLINLSRIEGYNTIVKNHTTSLRVLDLSEEKEVTPELIIEAAPLFANLTMLIMGSVPLWFSREEASNIVNSFPNLACVYISECFLSKSLLGILFLEEWANAKQGRTFKYTLKNQPRHMHFPHPPSYYANQQSSPKNNIS